MRDSGERCKVDQQRDVLQPKSILRATSCPDPYERKEDKLPPLNTSSSLPCVKQQHTFHATDNRQAKCSSTCASNLGPGNSLHFSVRATSPRTVPSAGTEHDSPTDMTVQWPAIAGFGIGMATSLFAIFLCFIDSKGPRTTAFLRGLSVGICLSTSLFIVFFLFVYIAPILY